MEQLQLFVVKNLKIFNTSRLPIDIEIMFGNRYQTCINIIYMYI